MCCALIFEFRSLSEISLNRHILTSEAIDRIFEELRPLSLDQLQKYPQIHPSRADILLAGIIILRETMRKVERIKNNGKRPRLALRHGDKNAQTLFNEYV